MTPTKPTLVPGELDLIRESFDKIRSDPSGASGMFYDNLFKRAPALRKLFRDDLEGQGMKFMSTLAVIVDTLHAPERLADRYRDLGRLHAQVGVTTTMFAPMCDALIFVIADKMGDNFTPELEAAWRKAFNQMADTMQSGGEIPAG